MDEAQLKDKVRDLTEKFDLLDRSRQDMVKQRAALDKKLAEIREEQLRLQGQYQLLQSMLKEPTKEKGEKKREKGQTAK